MKLRVFKILKKTKVEGPEIRYCIWVQGCSRRCKGCQAVHTWSHFGGELIEVNEIINDTPEVINEDAENSGWLLRVKLLNPEQLNDLMDLSEYQEFCNIK